MRFCSVTVGTPPSTTFDNNSSSAAQSRNEDRFHTVVTGDRVGLLAACYLEQADLWWGIFDYNDISFSLQLKVGTVLRILSVEHGNTRLLD